MKINTAKFTSPLTRGCGYVEERTQLLVHNFLNTLEKKVMWLKNKLHVNGSKCQAAFADYEQNETDQIRCLQVYGWHTEALIENICRLSI